MNPNAPHAEAPTGLPNLFGYETIEKIGAGGYGEVWKVRVPGSIPKALKLVFGRVDDERAVREMRAFDRMKEVRHPFVLSIERVEMADQKLAILTELADGSLKQRFDVCRERGMRGIPRDELLDYLRDAADALDYICRAHQLQHLDVKPENLLLMAGRVKVADFGLVRAIDDPSSSAFQTLTPLYAAPELFDGHPHQHSDQYSLALVYHEMLLGTLPFSGRTTAQLAAQHIYGRPTLSELPLADQGVISRALSKDPQQRFPSCRALIDALASQSGTISKLPAAALTVAAPIPAELRKTRTLSDGNSRPSPGPSSAADRTLADPHTMQSTAAIKAPSRSAAPLQARTSEPGPIDLTNEVPVYRPTLVLGLGGFGLKTLRHLNGRLRDRFGHRTEIQALQMLSIDIDPQSVAAALGGDPLGKLRDNQVVTLPLRSANDYRDQTKELLTWLNRRWLYNLPRSKQTEGFRPLGRLALVDHAGRMWDAIRHAISEACNANGLIASSAVTGLNFQNVAPRVVVVASSSGGAGSGIAVDVVFGVRRQLAELGLSDEHVQLVLVHGTDRRSTSRDLSLASSYACVRELYHYCRFPFASTERNSTNPSLKGLPETYLVQLGDDLGDEHFDAGARMVAEFVYRSSLTSATAFFEACRHVHSDRTDEFEPMVCSVGLQLLDRSKAEIPAEAVNALCRTMVETWRCGAQALQKYAPATGRDTILLRNSLEATVDSRSTSVERIVQLADSMALSIEGTIETLSGLVQRCMGARLMPWFEHGTARLTRNPSDAIADLLETPFSALLDRVKPHITRLVGAMQQALAGGLVKELAAPDYRLRGARDAAEALLARLQEIKEHCSAELTTTESRATMLGDQVESLGWPGIRELLARLADGSQSTQPLAAALSDLAQTLFDRIVLQCVVALVSGIRSQLVHLNQQLAELGRDLEQAAKEFPAACKVETDPKSSAWYDACPEVAQELAPVWTSLVAELERDVSVELTGSPQGLGERVQLESEVRNELGATLRVLARAVILRARAQASARHGGNGRQLAQALQSAAAGAQPRWLSCGGDVRRLVVLNVDEAAEAWSPSCEQAVGGAATVIRDPRESALVCVAAEHIPLREIAAKLAEGRSEVLQLADRLLTRTDVPWSPLG